VALSQLRLKKLSMLGHFIKQLPQPPTEHHDYEEIQANYQINSPQRPAPPRPAGVGSGGGHGTYGGTGTLGTYTELEGVPFVMDVRLQRNQAVNDVSDAASGFQPLALIRYSKYVCIDTYTARNLYAAQVPGL